MATGAADVPQVNNTSSQAQEHVVGSPSTGVEMSDLPRQDLHPVSPQLPSEAAAMTSATATTMSTPPPATTNTSITAHTPHEASTSAPVAGLESSIPATGDAPTGTDKTALEQGDGADASETIAAIPIDEGSESAGSRNPVVDIVLLPMNGNRYPCKISTKYLRNQKIEVENMDPFNISVYTLKELIWRDWKGDWETRPTNPGGIRLINMGRVLEDKQLLKDCRFSTNFPTVLHMSVKPQQDADEEDGKMGKAGSRADRDDSEQTAGCRCVIL